MSRGRRPDPQAVRDAKGNPGKRAKPVVDAAAMKPGGIIKPLAKLTPAAAAIWQSLGPDLERLNFIRGTDRELFGRYCQTVVEYWEATRHLRLEGSVYWTETLHGKMKRINPYFLVQERLAARLVPMEDRLGLNPASRQQLLIRLSTLNPQLPFNSNAVPDSRPPDDMADIGFLGSAGVPPTIQ